MVELPGDVLDRYPRFSRYNSPYPEHDAGTAIDLYPDRDDQVAPSPVAGEVVDVRTVRCPPKPYAVEHDHLLVVDTGDYLARILHVDPAVAVGDTIEIGDSLGTLVRSGFFAPWVANHLHVAFRDHDADPVRATGSLPLDLGLDTPLEPVPWDGTGTVVDTGDTWVLLDEPAHPVPGQRFAGIASDDGRVLDGGLPHYDYGGIRTPEGSGIDGEYSETVSLLGTTVGDVHQTPVESDAAHQKPPVSEDVVDGLSPGDRWSVEWRDVTVLANDEPITGLSLFFGRDWLGAKLVHRDHDWDVGDELHVTIRPRADRGDGR